MISIRNVLDRFKTHWKTALDGKLIRQACEEEGHTWRERCLGPATTFRLFLLQVLHGNAACAEMPHLARVKFTASAYCQARQRLPLGVIQRVVRAVIASFVAASVEVGLWRGHRLWYVDGSSFSMPDTDELQACFGQPGAQRKGCGFPVASFLALCDARSGLLVDVLPRPLRSHDMSGVVGLHPHLRPGDLLIGDRAFGSYAHLALLYQAGIHGVFRLHQRRKTSFRKPRASGTKRRGAKKPPRQGSVFVRKLAKYDQWVDYLKPAQAPSWMSREQFAALPDRVPVRELRYPVKRRGYRTRVVTLVTTLRDPEKYPAAELAAIYGDRWSIETNFRHLKTTMKMDVLRCQTVEGVLKELWMFVLAYNLVRMVMLAAARRQGVPVERISFVDALRWLLHAPPGAPLTDLHVNPDRRGRVEPRVRKRRPKQYPLMKRPRKELRNQLMYQAVAS